MLLNKLNLTFLVSPFCSDIENIETGMYLHGYYERMFLIQEQCTWIFLTNLKLYKKSYMY